MDHFSDLPKLCPDFKIASEVKCKRTKTKSVVTNVMAPHFHSNLVHSLKKAPFPLIINETTNISTKIELALVTRQCNKKTGKVSCSLYELVEQTSGDAEAIFHSICSVLENDGIPFSNVVGFAADTTNVLFGQHNSIVSRFKQKVSNLFTLHCICRCAHLCASHACEKLPRTPDDLIHNVYNYFAHSAKRQPEFQKFQYFADVEPHKILKRCQTRWLS
ncbi:PREDICTED: uncharacterized protein LOC105313698 [Amphimedon queenslandica]|uniref:DUF4371 domain-containing protein n=1 Tax=Amphimedon queenslandica TaxID=400682 RepID=A0A1X7U9P9_AMPQE|nr:PREDICTED: uncharacterized protein LOC105313698 [Amphimedon queenslandica]|eukprot:XP_011405639.1 PREDICTED: uncharacterized protein LOC105313698 [Amphimedon queenslandica]